MEGRVLLQWEVRARFLVAIRFYQKLKETSLRRILKVSAQGNSFNGYTFYLEKNMKVFCADGRIGDFSQLQFSAGKRQRAFHLRGQIDLEGRVLLQWENRIATKNLALTSCCFIVFGLFARNVLLAYDLLPIR